jgi:hypothetical protein
MSRRREQLVIVAMIVVVLAVLIVPPFVGTIDWVGAFPRDPRGPRSVSVEVP